MSKMTGTIDNVVVIKEAIVYIKPSSSGRSQFSKVNAHGQILTWDVQIEDYVLWTGDSEDEEFTETIRSAGLLALGAEGKIAPATQIYRG
jgi:hypothetical protein